MANAILTPSIIAKEMMVHLENEAVLAKKINTDYSTEFTGSVGNTIDVRRPIRMLGQADNLDVSSFTVDIEDANVPVVMNETYTVKFKLSALERTLDIRDDRVQRVIQNAAIKMRDYVESRIATVMKNAFYHFSGTPGTRPATFLSLATAGAYMTDAAVPMDPRCAVHSPLTAAHLADSFKQQQTSRGKNDTALEKVSIGYHAGFDNYSSVHIPRHTVGAHAGTPLVNGADQNVTYAASKATWTQSLITNGWSNSVTGILKAGDVITIGGVFEVNPISKQSTGRLQNFVVTADADSGASTGPSTLTISPPIIISGPYQTVSAAPADDAPITVKTGTASTAYEQSLLFHRDAMLMVTRPIDVPGDAGLRTATATGNMMSIRVSESTDFNTLDHSHRLDILFGLKATAPYLGHRLTA
jgi:hypothetical protein